MKHSDSLHHEVDIMKHTFNVKGMHCKSCELVIKEALEDTNGVEKAEVSLKKGTAHVYFNEETVDEAQLKASIIKEGYTID